MNICGDSAMVEQATFQSRDGGSIPTSPLQFEFVEVKAKYACELNETWHSRLPKIHWSNVVRNRHYVCYVARFKAKDYAVGIWSTPCAANRMHGGQTILELRRLAINDECPQFTATRMISIMVKLIRKKFPDVWKLISYQDTAVHKGTIYKAAGWTVDGETKFIDWSTTKRKRRAIQSDAGKIRYAKMMYTEKELIERLAA